MSAFFKHELRNGSLLRDATDDKMEQIRELLFGKFKRDSDARLALVEARVRELEAGIHRKLDAIQSRLEQLSVEMKSDRNASFEELSHSVVDLAERIRRIGRP
jgi:DNA anti-recombination protein RmuC